MPPNNAEQPITSDSSVSPDDTAAAVAPVATKATSQDVFPEADVSTENGTTTGMDEPQDFPVTDAPPLHEEPAQEPAQEQEQEQEQEEEKQEQVPEQVPEQVHGEIPENHHQHDQQPEQEQEVAPVAEASSSEKIDEAVEEPQPDLSGSVSEPALAQVITPQTPASEPAQDEQQRKIKELEQMLAQARVSVSSQHLPFLPPLSIFPLHIDLGPADEAAKGRGENRGWS